MDSAALFLVIDDDRDLLEGMVRILLRDGHRVITASTGTEGVRLALEQRPDMAIIDVTLPDMHGIAVCRQIQAGTQLGIIDIILISSTNIAAEDQAKGFNAGVCEYITRPLPNREFLARVNARLKEKQIRDSLTLDRDEAREISDQEKTYRIDLEEELQTIFLHAPVCLFLTDGNARLLKANPALAKIFGGDVPSKIGAPCGIAFDCSYNADHSEGCGSGPHCATCCVRNAITVTFSTGMSHIQVQSYLNCRQGDQIVERIVSFSTSLVTVSGDKRVFVCMEDITDRRRNEIKISQSEELFRRTFDQSPIGAAMVGLDYRFLKVNQELCRITGYQADEFENLRFADITFADDLRLDLKQAEDLVHGLIDQYEMDKRYIRKDGKLVWVRLSVRLIRDSQGAPDYYLPMMVEIDVRKRLEEEKDIQLEMFHLIREDSDLKKMLTRVLSFLKDWSGVDAIAVRLHQGKDFPYYKTIGFPKEFVHRENSLKSSSSKDRQPSRKIDQDSLECMCGCVISRLSDTSLPFFTKGGSFFTNSTSMLLSQSDNLQMFHGMRKHCNEAGYESVLLVPLRVGEKTLGLIQLNHKEKNHFSKEFVLLMERLSNHISVAVAQRLAEESLTVKQNELEEMNAALKVLIRTREEELQDRDREILANVHQLILPCVERLKLGPLNVQQHSQLNILESNLKTITSPFAEKLSSADNALTPSLLQVADMIKKGMSNKEMAKLLGISVNSVETYRKRIRARLNLQNSKINLQAHLMNMHKRDM